MTEHAAAADPDLVLAEIYRLLTPYNKEAVRLSEDTDMASDLNIDSVDTMDLLMAIEDRFDVSIPINLLADVRTIGDLCAVVCGVLRSGA